MSADTYATRPYRPGDEAGILSLFDRVFAAGRPGFPARTEAEWRWRFLENPAGTRVWVGLRGEEIVSQYASIPVRVLLEGRSATFGQIVDSMVDPAHRGGRLFVRTAEPFFDAFGGPDRDVVMYGYPVPIAWRIGAALLRYEIVRTETVLFREPPEPVSPAPPGLLVEEVRRFGPEADALWARVGPEFAAATVRDSLHLDWRYAAAPPSFRYRLALARGGGGEPRGLAVFRRAPFLAADAGVLCDWLVPSADGEAARALLAWASARAREEGVPVLGAVFPDSSPWFGWFQREGFLVAPTDYYMVGRPFDARYDMDWLRRRWFYTLGDTDLV
ncbi:MAG TPA: GNAT family N-acetyltransferase [Planctomycetota bacterium]|nr:GNAT family N-acetyltransferase [Planctomycetota bacterium]